MKRTFFSLAILSLFSACGGDGANNGQSPTVAQLCPIYPPEPISITTEIPGPIDSKSVRRKAIVEVRGQKYTSEARGRGNSTWAMPKKPYRFKLDSAAPLLDMTPEKDWVLLANYSDKTMLRTALAQCLGRIFDEVISPESRFVELTLNGEYQGLYQLTWQMETGENRIPASNGFLAEIDARRDGDIVQESLIDRPYVLDKEFETVAGPEILAMETAILQKKASARIDIPSFSAYYLIAEFSKNNDTFWSSTYLFQTNPGQKIQFGPLWDFDIAFGNIDFSDAKLPQGEQFKTYAFPAAILRDKKIQKRVQSDWSKLSPKIPELIQWLDTSALNLEAAQSRNFQKWPILTEYVWPNAVVTGSYFAEVQYLKTWVQARADYLNSQNP